MTEEKFISDDSDGTEIFMDWKKICKLNENDRYILVYFKNGKAAFIINKSSLQDGNRDQIVEFVKRKLS